MTKTHTHEFVKDQRPKWPGFTCTKCGFHIHANLEEIARNAGARFVEAPKIQVTRRELSEVE